MARFAGFLIALVAAVSLALQWADLIGDGGMEPVRALWAMARFFTVLTACLVTLTFGAIAFGWVRPHTRWLASLTISSLFLAAVYYLFLAGLRPLSPTGLWADRGLHIAVPVLVVGWWLIFAPKSRLDYDHVPGFLTWPVIYTAYAITRGGIDRVFPYPFLDPLAIGWPAVLWNMAEFAVALAVAGVLLVLLARMMTRAGAAAR